MRAATRSLATLALAALLVPGCATVQGWFAAGPPTPLQQVATAQNLYSTWADAVIAYKASPGAQPAAVAKLQGLDRQMFAALEAMYAAEKAGQGDQVAQQFGVINALAAQIAQELNAAKGGP